MRKFMVLLAGVASLAVAACNTVAGAGEDVQAAGAAVEGVAEDAKN
jgi:predicted small secreted protein